MKIQHFLRITGIFWLFIIVTPFLLSCSRPLTPQAQAELNSIDFLLEKRKDILVLDSAQFGPLDAMSEADSSFRVRYRLPYMTKVLNKNKLPESSLVQILLDSGFNVIRVSVLPDDRIKNLHLEK